MGVGRDGVPLGSEVCEALVRSRITGGRTRRLTVDDVVAETVLFVIGVDFDATLAVLNVRA